MRKAMAGIVIFLCTVLLTGCWDKKELNKMAVVMGVGLDKSGDGRFKMTAQVIKPSPPQKGGSGGAEVPTWSLSASGITVMDAIEELNRISPRRLYWPHLQLLAFGEELARSGISPVLTWFERDRDSRAGTYVVVTRGRAEDLLNHKIELGNVPARAMADLIDSAAMRQITARKTTLRDLTTIMVTPGIDPIIDVIDPQKIRSKVETYGLRDAAVFRRGQLVGFLTSKETAAAEIVNGQYRNAVLNTACPGKGREDGYLSYLVTDFRKTIRLVKEDSRYVMKMHLFLEGNIGDQTCILDIDDPLNRTGIERAVSKEVKAMIEDTFKKTAAWKSDVYGVGRELRRHYPLDWRNHREAWPELLPQTELSITVDASIRRSGLVLEPSTGKIE